MAPPVLFVEPHQGNPTRLVVAAPGRCGGHTVPGLIISEPAGLLSGANQRLWQRLLVVPPIGSGDLRISASHTEP